MNRKDFSGPIDALIRRSEADYTIVSASRSYRKVLRFSDFRVKQSLSDDIIGVSIKAICGNRAGAAVAGSLEASELGSALKDAIDIACSSKPDKSVIPPSRNGVSQTSPSVFCPITDKFSIAEAFSAVSGIFDMARRAGVNIAGTLIFGGDEELVMDSGGFEVFRPSTISSLKLIATSADGGSAHSCRVTRDISDIDIAAETDRCIKRSCEARSPRAIDPGLYECILRPEAVGELMSWLSYTAFGAGQLYDGTSFIKGRIGKKVMDEKLTIYDDGKDSGTLVSDFDCEGVSKKKTYFVRNGIAAGFAYDTYYGNMYGLGSTGHAVSLYSSAGPMPSNIIIESGNSSESDMVRSVKRGLLVNRFHYVNGLLDTRNALMTGLTRDGLFFIEDGKIKYPVRDLRFTDSIMDAFKRIGGISKERVLISDPAGDSMSVLTPSILVSGLRFTSNAG